MKSPVKLIVLVSVLVLGLGVSLWVNLHDSSGSKAEANRIGVIKQKYKCAKCGEQFELTVADAEKMRASKGSVLCPKCGATGTTKTSAAPALVKSQGFHQGGASSTEGDGSDAGNGKPTVHAVGK